MNAKTLLVLVVAAAAAIKSCMAVECGIGRRIYWCVACCGHRCCPTATTTTTMTTTATSPWSSPVVLIRKKDGNVRFCVNYKALNAITPQDQFPLLRIDDILDRLGGSTWFTSLDLKSGYWQISMHADSIPFHNGVSDPGRAL